MAVLFVNDLVADISMLLVRLRVSVHYPAHMCHFISSSVHLDLKFLPSFSSDCFKFFFLSKILSLACQFV